MLMLNIVKYFYIFHNLLIGFDSSRIVGTPKLFVPAYIKIKAHVFYYS